jgi:hypothetical protein
VDELLQVEVGTISLRHVLNYEVPTIIIHLIVNGANDEILV